MRQVSPLPFALPVALPAALPVVGGFARRLLADDLPDLPTDRRDEAVAFIARRIDTMPEFTRLGVLLIGMTFRTLLALPGGWRLATVVSRLPIPLFGEFPRLVRSLGYAYVWERWPATTPSGGAA
jgi:hypothetical protein